MGEALAAAYATGLVRRDDLFLQTKFTYARGQDHRLPYDPSSPVEEQVLQSFESSLEHLGTDHVDALLLHGPEFAKGITPSDLAVYRTMETLVTQGRVRLIGVSNVSAEQLRELARHANIAPAFVQNRCYARSGWDLAVRRVCAEIGARYQAFSLLTANGRELENRDVRAMAARTGRSVPELVFRFALEVGMIPLTGSGDPRHLADDLSVGGFELDPRDRATLEHLALT